jgi:hypothetical protein
MAFCAHLSHRWETTELQIAYDTPLQLIEALRQRINAYIQENSREWSNCNLRIDRMEYQNSIHIVIGVERASASAVLSRVDLYIAATDRPNWQDWGGRWTRRNAFMKHMKTTLEDLEITYMSPIQPVLLPSSVMPSALSPPPSRLQSTSSTSGPQLSPSSIGNAGRFQGSDYMRRAPGRQLEPCESSFASGQTAVER